MKIPVARNLFHFSGAVIPICYLLFGRIPAIYFSLSLLIVILAFDILRIVGKLRLGWAEACFKAHERQTFSGSLFFALSAFITVLIFKRDAAVASLLVLAIADPLSSVVGRYGGRIFLIRGKTFEGSLTFFSSTFLILLAFRFAAGPAVIASVVATLTELVTPSFIDDNLSLPVVTAITLTLVS